MKRRLFTLFLAVLLTVGAIPWAIAADSSPFSTVQTYRNQFTDVSPDNWYYSSVKMLYELGLTNGQGTPDRFAPNDTVTVAEAITIAARLRSLYEYQDSEAGPNQYKNNAGPWYSSYAAYLQSCSVIGDEFKGQYRQPATRAQVAHIFARTLPASLFTAINAEAVAVGYASRSYIQDVTEYTPHQQDILALYQWGILSGMDRTGSFHPNASIQRSQVAAMTARLAYSDFRISLDWDVALTTSKIGTTLQDLVYSDGTFHTSPSPHDMTAIDDNVRYMLSRGERRIILSYGKNTLTTDTVSALMEAFLQTIFHYLEQSYNEVECSYSISSGSMVLTFSSSLYDDRMIDSYREATIESAIMVHDSLWSDGTITASMSDYDKARIYYTWLCNHCQYDYNSTPLSLSHSGYNAFVNALAVCDGYTAAYNLLLKLEGIECSTKSTTDHTWTVANLDGTTYHIDPTWGDQSDTISYRYFAMTEAFSLSRFS